METSLLRSTIYHAFGGTWISPQEFMPWTKEEKKPDLRRDLAKLDTLFAERFGA